MQLNQCEKKLTKLDEDFKKVSAENNNLRKQIQAYNENGYQPTHDADSINLVEKLRREIDDRDKELFKLTHDYNDMKDDNEHLKMKLVHVQTQIGLLNEKLRESYNETENVQHALDEREKMIAYLNNNIKELNDMLKELQSSSSQKPDFESTASFDLLNSTPNDLNNSSE